MAIVESYQNRINRYRDRKYDVESHSYPIDLFEEGSIARKYGENCVMFFINVNEDSKVYRTRRGANGNQAPGERNITANRRYEFFEDVNSEFRTGSPNNLAATNRNLTAGIAAGVSTGSAVAGAIFGERRWGTIAGALAYSSLAITPALISDISGSTRQLKRMKTAIGMHIPNNLRINYQSRWQESDTQLVSALVEILDIGVDEVREWLFKPPADSVGPPTVDESAENIRNNFWGRIGGLAANAALTLDPILKKPLSISTGLAPNPRKELYYEGLGFRDFTLNFQLAPRSREEAIAIKNIIYQFKYHMAPEYKDISNFLFVYPSEFDIAYYQGDEENKSLHRHPSSVLTNMSINYTPNGLFNTIEDQHPDVKGLPAQVNMSLEFRELTLITKELIEQGF